MDFLTKALGDHDSVDILFIDYEKAFDKVPHKRLLVKLAGYGINGKVVKWIKAFLTNRRQRVVLGSHISELLEVSSGVPQGSVDGPVLFVVYVNDLPRSLCVPSKLYADDTKVFARLEKGNEMEGIKRLQTAIDQIRRWTSTWLMSLNMAKSKIMHLGKNNPRHVYMMVTHKLETTECE